MIPHFLHYLVSHLQDYYSAVTMGERDGVSPSPPAFTIPTRNSAVSLSSLLSSESDHHSRPAANSNDTFDAAATVAPIALPPPASRLRGALSSLMNSPMDDERTPPPPRRGETPPTAATVAADPLSPVSPAAESPREPHVAADAGDVDALTDLESLQRALQSAALRLLSAEDGSGGPPAKRQKKGKHGRKQKASTTTAGVCLCMCSVEGSARVNGADSIVLPTAVDADESAAEIHKCIELLNLRVQNEAEVLRDVVRFCLALCAELSEKDPVEKSVVKKNAKSDAGEPLDFDATLAALPLKPLYFQLLSVVRRAVFSADEQDARALMAQVLEWCLATPVPANWSWVLAFVGQISSFAVLEFLVHELVFSETDKDGVIVVPTIEHLVAQNSAQLVDIVRDLVEDAASDGVAEIHGKSVQWVVRRVISVATEFPVFLRACDDSLQFLVTKEVVIALASKVNGESTGDGAQHNGVNGSPLSALLLQLLEKRSTEMVYSGFQLIVLLQALSSKASFDVGDLPLASTEQLAEAASAFHVQVLAMAEREETPRVFLAGVHRFLPYICQSALQSLRSSRQQTGKDAGSEMFEHWRRWLVLMAQRISQTEVTRHLIEADLMLSEVPKRDPTASAATTVLPHDVQLSNLLSSILTPLSVDYVQFVKEMMDSCNAAAPRAHQRRVLSILQALLQQNGSAMQQSRDEAISQLPIDVRVASSLTIEDAVDQLTRVESWSQSWKRFEMWKGAEGVSFWEGFVDLACSRDPEVASRALALVSQTPFQTLEDPMWQYRCLRKLTSVFFHLLRQYRAEIVSVKSVGKSSAASLESTATQQRLEKMKTVLFQVLALDGGVAHYASSVYTTFASLWVDALFSTTSPTSIPTHFPNRVNFSAGEEWEGGVEDRVVIRSERTISSKCTNLQSSQVITQISDTRVYRKALDSSWEREMNAAHTCSMYATDLVFQLVNTTVPLAGGSRSSSGTAGGGRHGGSDYVERKLKAVTDLLLERAIPGCGIPNDEVYKETLPNRSSFDMDLRIEQWLNHFPSFLPLLRAVVTGSASIGSSQSLRLVPLVKSALVVLLGHWNSVKGELSRENMDVPPYMRNRNQLALTCELVQILRLTGWLPPPLGRTAELLPLTTPADIRGILFSCWFYLSDHPPSDGLTPASSRAASPTSAASSPSTGGGGSSSATNNSHANVPLEFYLVPLRKALHNNIRTIGAKYPLFMC